EESLTRVQGHEKHLSVTLGLPEGAPEPREDLAAASPEDARPLGLGAGHLGGAEPALERASCNLHLWKLWHFWIRQLARVGIKPWPSDRRSHPWQTWARRT